MRIQQWYKSRSKAYYLGLATFAAFIGIAGGLLTRGPSVVAGVCDTTNIIRCGLDGTSQAQLIDSFRSFYTTNRDTVGHTDLQSIFNWTGYNASIIAGMNTSNTRIGYVYRNGDVKVDGQLVGTGAVVTTRYAGSGRTQILPGVYIRSASENTHEPESVLITFDQTGQAIGGGVMTLCGNGIKFTPVKRLVQCVNLVPTATGKLREYQLVATATATNMTISGYTFDFGDGSQPQVVTTGAGVASVTHQYPADASTYTARVTVNATDAFGAANSACQAVINTPSSGVSIEKKVDGVKSEQVAVGQNFVYQLTVKNTGQIALSNVVVSDTPGANTNIQLLSVKDNLGTITGNTWTYTIPSLAVNQSVTFSLTAKVTAYADGSLVNTACVNAPEVNPGNPTQQDGCDTATVTVPKPVYSCDSLTVTENDETRTANANVVYTANNGATLKSVVFVWGDNNSSAPSTQTSASHTYAADGTYTITAKLVFSVNGTDAAPADNPACSKVVTLEKPTSKTPSVKIEKKVEGKESIAVEVGKNYTYSVKVTNDGQVDLKNVVVTDTPHTGSNVQLLSVKDNLGTITGNTWTYTIPSLKIGESMTFYLTAKVTEYTEGNLVNTACVNAAEVNPTAPNEQDACDDAIVTVNKPVVPGYSCDELALTAGANRTVTAELKKYTATGGATLVSIVYIWGDGSKSSPSKDTKATHTYGADGTYTVSAELTFGVPGTADPVVVSGDNCAKSVTFTGTTPPVTPPATPPQVLPNTGAGSVIGLFGLVSVLGALGYRLFLGRKVRSEA